jgi:hypothetical protein
MGHSGKGKNRSTKGLSQDQKDRGKKGLEDKELPASAKNKMARSWLMETILLSICLEHGKMIEEILAKLKEW